jgi:transposase
MIRIMLNDATGDGLRALRRTASPAEVRDRIEMVAPSDAGRSEPRIAAHLGYHPRTVRDRLRSSSARGAAALRPFRSGPAPDAGRHDRVVTALRRLLAEERTWTSGQLSRALAEHGIDLGARQVRRYLKRMGARYRRTGSTLKHKQDPAKAERAGKVLANLKARAAAGLLKLYYLDECGFAPTLPTVSGWTPPGERKLVDPGPAGQRPGGLSALRPRTEAGGVHRRADVDLVRPARLPRGLAVVEGASCGGPGQRGVAHREGGPGGEVGPGPPRHLPVLPAAV